MARRGGYVAWDTRYMCLSSYDEREVRVQAIPPVHNLWAKWEHSVLIWMTGRLGQYRASEEHVYSLITHTGLAHKQPVLHSA